MFNFFWSTFEIEPKTIQGSHETSILSFIIASNIQERSTTISQVLDNKGIKKKILCDYKFDCLTQGDSIPCKVYYSETQTLNNNPESAMCTARQSIIDIVTKGLSEMGSESLCMSFLWDF